MLLKLINIFVETIHSPKKVFYICSCILFYNLFLSGSIVKIWRLRTDQTRLENQIQLVKTQNIELVQKIKQAQDPEFIQRQAIDRFDMVSENDLVFYFPE